MPDGVGRERKPGILFLVFSAAQLFHNEGLVLLTQKKGDRHQSKQEVNLELVATESMC